MKIKLLVLFSFLLSLALTACGGPNIHKDLTPDPNILLRRWTLSTHGAFQAGDRGTEYSNPVMSDNTLIFGNQSVGLIALYPTLNQQRWVLPIPKGVMSELAIDKGSVYFGGEDGYLYSVNADNGRVNWRYEIRNPVISRPTISGGRLFITTSDDTVYAFDAGTGKWLWHYRRRSAPISTILGASAPLVDGNEVITGLSDGFVVSLNISDGQLKWEKKIHEASKFTDVDAHPVLENGVIYIPSYDGALYALKRNGGDTIWRFDAGGSKDVTLDGDVVYLPSTEGSIYSVQKSNGKPLWKFELDHGTPTRLIVTDKYIIVGSSFQYMYVIDKRTGKGVYRFNVGYGSGFSGSPAYDEAHKRVYFLSGAGNLYAFELSPERKVRKHGQTSPYTFIDPS
jgi:outer membrane protein assembly factor BamB